MRTLQARAQTHKSGVEASLSPQGLPGMSHLSVPADTHRVLSVQLPLAFLPSL